MKNADQKLNALARFIGSAHDEINAYRRFKTETTGHELTWEQAVQQWLEKHFANWKSYQWHIAVEQAIHLQEVRQPVGFLGDDVSLPSDFSPARGDMATSESPCIRANDQMHRGAVVSP